MGKLMKLLLVLALVVTTAAHGARAARSFGARDGGAVTHAARLLLSRPSCCTHDGNTVGSSCCPQQLPL
ncbi:hypothetical protein E2562_001474 [Oryza meyeriana var. granulata]|uniref:Hydrophobic seed protein domain-containing protein n=1 Tax=Oryza meyeriana var. granulata TaxID=110450 RepID=A0A6G1DCB4_9ORYZ|nr:hypothetical protein E2562_001474 [Oryza meyeriana var. granulata]